MHAEDPVQRMQKAPNGPLKQTIDSAASNSDTSSSRL